MNEYHKQLIDIATAHSKMDRNKIRSHLSFTKSQAERKISGDVVECGVWRGGSALITHVIYSQYNHNVVSHLYDSFEGLPAPGKEDYLKEGENRKVYRNKPLEKGQLADCDYTSVKKLMAKHTNNNVKIHKGFIRSAKDLIDHPNHITFLHIDLDFYDGYRIVLDALYEKVTEGGTILFDDYKCFIGPMRAVDEFCHKTGEKVKLLADELYTTPERAYIVKGER